MPVVEDTTPNEPQVIRPFNAAEDYTVAVNARSVVVLPGSTTQSTTQDATFNVYTSATVQRCADYRVAVPVLPRLWSAPAFTSSDPTVATVDAAGTVTPVAAGSTTIAINVPGFLTRKFVLNVVQQGGSTTSFSNFVTGSLGRHTVDAITTLLTGKTAPTWNTYPPPWNAAWALFTQDGTRNGSGWWGGTDTTCIPRISGNNGVLVTKRDMIFAAHFGVSSSVTFKGSDGTDVVRSVVASRAISTPTGDGADIVAATLNADVPATVTPAKVMPAAQRAYLPQPQNGYPAVFTNQDRALLIGDSQGVAANGVYQFSQAFTDPTRHGWFYGTRANDSGSPVFMLVNGALVLLTYLHYNVGGPVLADNLSQINAAIAANGSPYAVSPADLSGFTSF